MFIFLFIIFFLLILFLVRDLCRRLHDLFSMKNQFVSLLSLQKSKLYYLYWSCSVYSLEKLSQKPTAKLC